MSFGFGLSFPRFFQSSGAAPPSSTDSLFPYVSLLVPGDGTNGTQNNTFLDASTNTFPITRNNTPTQGTFTPFSQTGWSGLFNGNGDFLTTTTAAITTNNFTFEAWVNISSSTVYGNNPTLFGIGTVNAVGSLSIFLTSATTLYLRLGTGGDTIATIPTLQNAWNHIAIVRTGSTITVYINGVSQSVTSAGGGTSVTATDAYIGRQAGFSTTGYFNGFVSNLRFVNGVAVYTGAFTPPTAPLTITQSAGTNISAITGTQTSLLTLQSNYFRDQTAANSGAGLTITVTGTPSIQAFSPFEPTAAYAAATNGGAVYFNGSTDYLYTPSNAAFAVGTVFTVELWVWPTTVTNMVTLGALGIGWNGASQWGVANTGVAWVVTSATMPTQSAWNHVAIVRTGTGTNQTAVYLNGVSVAVGTYTPALTTSVIAYIGSGNAGASTLGGYMSNLRIVKGTAVYTANFTPPTAPLTAISGTSLLLSGTNAGIIDNSAKNTAVITVGNAQVSTAQSQWGGGSMLFDGTGDWVTVADAPLLRFGTGDFTIEGWVYKTTTGTAVSLVSKGAAATGWTLGVSATNFLTASYTATTLTGTVTTLSANTWYYFAMVRSGTATGNIKLYINGTLQASSATAITTDFTETDVLYIGASRTATTPLTGYIDDLRITKAARTVTTTPTAAFPLY